MTGIDIAGRGPDAGAGVDARNEPITPEAQLVALCVKLQATQPDEVAIRSLLADGIDWTTLAQMLVERGLASRAGHKLIHLAPELLPYDIAGALGAVVDQTRATNDELLAQLAG